MKTMICLENVSYSQFNYEAITQVNRFCEQSNEEVCFVTLDQTMPFTQINTAVYAPYDMDSFHNGLIIAHTLNLANRMLGCTNNSKKVLYLYDLDWMFQPIFYDEIYSILNNPDLFLIARSQDHADIIQRTCSRKVDAILDNFNLEDIWNSL
jgi:hypothetical protein